MTAYRLTWVDCLGLPFHFIYNVRNAPRIAAILVIPPFLDCAKSRGYPLNIYSFTKLQIFARG